MACTRRAIWIIRLALFVVGASLSRKLVVHIVPLFLYTKIFLWDFAYSPGNLRRSMDMPFVVRCLVRSSVCVVLPDLSRPSMTTNAPRVMITVVDDF
jgi:hypothetical protein